MKNLVIPLRFKKNKALLIFTRKEKPEGSKSTPTYKSRRLYSPKIRAQPCVVNFRLLRSLSGLRVSVLDSKQKSAIGRDLAVAYCRGARNSMVSAKRELTVSLVLISISLPISQTAYLDRSKKKKKKEAVSYPALPTS